jgi:hypothetical protein
MLSAEIISAFIKLSLWIKPGLNHLYCFIVGALEGKESSHLKGKTTRVFKCYKYILQNVQIRILRNQVWRVAKNVT